MGGHPRLKVLTERFKRLIDLYFTVSNFDKTDATRRAGYRHPNKYSTQLFKKPAIVAEIDRRHRVAQEKHDITHDLIMQEMRKIGFSSLGDFMEFDEATGNFIGINLNRDQMEQIAALGEVKIETYLDGRGDEAVSVKRVTVKPYNKLAALEAMMKHGGLSKDKGHEALDNLVDLIRAGRSRVGKTEDGE